MRNGIPYLVRPLVVYHTPLLDGVHAEGFTNAHSTDKKRTNIFRYFRNFISDISETQFISDTGATRGVAGSEPMSALLSHLPQEILARVRKIASQVTFRFGNMKTLTSMFAVLIPISHICKTYLRFEIVKAGRHFYFPIKLIEL